MQGYPRIKGPKSVHDRIAIIGAGPSGLHMAYELKVHNLLLYYNCTTLNKSFKCSPNIMYWIWEINTFVCLAVTLSDFHLTLKWLRRCSDLKIWLWDYVCPMLNVMNTSAWLSFPHSPRIVVCLLLELTIHFNIEKSR